MRLPMRIFVPGPAVAQPRQRSFVRKDGKAGTYCPRSHPVHAFKDAVALLARQAMGGDPPLDGALRVDVQCYLAPPKAHGDGTPGPHHWKPDRDNIDKAVLDALTGVVFRNDCQVSAGEVRKRRCGRGSTPHTIITIALDY